ncbi:MAG TPA: UDP-N-acetylglucosamine 1-carboxyvinyltransferase [Firmicutes bacterium]|jgi:UDP-N-acetylglucosamine 1-carboxyvinyltransferase|nr:UDP-N-acetylglucosamine 1-carboxyvinyltransferase [Bacillota bacterium]
MEKIVVEGGYPLHGEVSINGSKNAALAVLVGAALGDEPCRIDNVPHYTDIYDIIEILRDLGAEIEWADEDSLIIDGHRLYNPVASYELVRKLRGSFYVAGLLLAKLGYCEVPLPGGDPFSSRPVNFHLKGFEALGAQVTVEHGYVKAKAKNLVGTTIYVGRSSVGATVNLMLAAALAEGITVLENAAREPEIVNLALQLNAMGAKIKGAGTNIITIEGVKKLGSAVHEIIPDRLEAGTFLMATTMTGGEVVLKDVVPEHLHSLISKLREAGIEIRDEGGVLVVHVEEGKRPLPTDIETMPYPGFATDFQPMFAALMTRAKGVSIVKETIFDRFAYVDELARMGADIKVEGDTAIIRGVERLTGAPVEVKDIRGGAALVIAALGAEGKTKIDGIYHLDRGYENLEVKLSSLGSRIRRISE